MDKEVVYWFPYFFYTYNTNPKSKSSVLRLAKVPPRVAFFSRLTSLGKILTTNNLHKRHIIVLDWCYMCKRCGESVDHLLLHCPIAFEMWSLLCLFGLQWVMPLKVIKLFESWQGKFKRHRNIDFWRLMQHCLMWCIWSERNARCFEGCEQSLLEIKSFFLHALVDWSIALSHCSCFSHFAWSLQFWFLIFAPTVHYKAQVRFQIRVWVWNSAISEKVECGCSGMRRLKNY